jgi:hypothetical protein
MAEWDRRLIAALFVYCLGTLLWFIGFLSPDVDEIPPAIPVAAPTMPQAPINGSSSASVGAFTSTYHAKMSIAAFFFKTMISVGTSAFEEI